MGASNGSNANGGGRSFFTLKENKAEGTAATGNIRFYKSIKEGDKWVLGEGFTQMSGFLNELEVKEYEWQGKKKHELVFKMTDDQTGQGLDVKTSFPTTVSKNILNGLANVNKFGLISIEIGKPQEYQGKWYPSVFTKNDGETCKFAYTKANGNQPPRIEYVKDEEGNEIKKGVVAERNFWLEQIEKINSKLKASPNAKITKPEPYVPVATSESSDTPDEEGDVPF